MKLRTNFEIWSKTFTTKTGKNNHVKNKICPKLKNEPKIRFDGSKTKVGFAILSDLWFIYFCESNKDRILWVSEFWKKRDQNGPSEIRWHETLKMYTKYVIWIKSSTLIILFIRHIKDVCDENIFCSEYSIRVHPGEIFK